MSLFKNSNGSNDVTFCADVRFSTNNHLRYDDDGLTSMQKIDIILAVPFGNNTHFQR